MQVACETKNEKMVMQSLMQGWLQCLIEPGNLNKNQEFQSLWCVADSCVLWIYRQPEKQSEPIYTFPLQDAVLEEFPESVAGSMHMAFSLRCRSPNCYLLLKPKSIKERVKWLATITQQRQRLFCFLDEDDSKTGVYYSLPHRPKLTRNLQRDNRKLCRLSLSSRTNFKMSTPELLQNHMTLREMIHNMEDKSKQLQWSAVPEVIAKDLPGKMTAKQVTLETLRLNLATSEIMFNNELSDLVTLAKRSITWVDPISSITRRTIASIVDKVKKCSDSVVAELEHAWKNKLTFDNLYIVLQQNMDKFNVYVVYCNHLQEFSTVLNNARGRRAGVEVMAFSNHYNMERELLPILRLKTICCLLREMQVLLVLNTSHLEHYHCKRTLTQLTEVLAECYKVLTGTIGSSFVQSLDKKMDIFCNNFIQMEFSEFNSNPSSGLVCSPSDEMNNTSQEDKQVSSFTGSIYTPTNADIGISSLEDKQPSMDTNSTCSPTEYINISSQEDKQPSMDTNSTCSPTEYLNISSQEDKQPSTDTNSTCSPTEYLNISSQEDKQPSTDTNSTCSPTEYLNISSQEDKQPSTDTNSTCSPTEYLNISSQEDKQPSTDTNSTCSPTEYLNISSQEDKQPSTDTNSTCSPTEYLNISSQEDKQPSTDTNSTCSPTEYLNISSQEDKQPSTDTNSTCSPTEYLNISSQEDKQPSTDTNSTCSPTEYLNISSQEDKQPSMDTNSTCSPLENLNISSQEDKQTIPSSKYCATRKVPTPKLRKFYALSLPPQEEIIYSNSQSRKTYSLYETKKPLTSSDQNYINLPNWTDYAYKWKSSPSKSKMMVNNISNGTCNENISGNSCNKQIDIESNDSLCNTSEIQSTFSVLSSSSELSHSAHSLNVCKNSESRVNGVNIYDSLVLNNNINDISKNMVNSLNCKCGDTSDVSYSSNFMLNDTNEKQDTQCLSKSVVFNNDSSDEIYENMDTKECDSLNVISLGSSEHMYIDLLRNSEENLEKLPNVTYSLDDGSNSSIENAHTEECSYCNMGNIPGSKRWRLSENIGEYENMANGSLNTGEMYHSYLEVKLKSSKEHVQSKGEINVEDQAQGYKENSVELEDNEYDEIYFCGNMTSTKEKDRKITRSSSNVSLSLYSMMKWRESFSSLHESPLLEQRKNSILDLPFNEAPLYQEYCLNIPFTKDDGVNFILLEDNYTYAEPLYEEIDLHHPHSDEENVHSPTIRKSSMILLEGNRRTLWYETEEVINSGLLDTLSAEERWLQESKFEIITSEVSFLKSLNILDNLYINSPELNKDILHEQDKKKLFGPITQVKKASELFLKDLVQVWEEDLLLRTLPHVINKHANQNFKVFIKYCSSQILANIILAKLRARNRKFVEVVEKLEMEPSCQNFSLQSFLMQPMQRITRLPILVDAIIKHLPVSDENHHAWVQLHKTLQMVVNECNEAVRQAEKMHNTKKTMETSKIKQIWNRLQWRKRENSTSQTESFA